MREVKARLHMHNHNTPGGRAYILADRAGLRALGEALVRTSQSVAGFETVQLYTSDGHRYELLVTCSISEDEWQALPTPYSKEHNPEKLEIVCAINEFTKSRVEAQK